MKKFLFIIFGMATTVQAFPIVSYIQSTSSLQPGATFYVSSGTVAGNFYNSSLANGQCVQAGVGGLLSSSGASCGTSGGSSSALQVTQGGVQITSPTASMNFQTNQFSLAAVGSTSTVALNSSSVTLQGQNVIDLTSSLQSGATFYVSSGTVQQQLIVGPATAGSPFGTTTEFVLNPQIQTINNGSITLLDQAGAGNLPRMCMNVSSTTATEGLCINSSFFSNSLSWSQGGVTGLDWSNGAVAFGNNNLAVNNVSGKGLIDSPLGTAIEVVGHTKIANAFGVSPTTSGSYTLTVTTQGVTNILGQGGLNTTYGITAGSGTFNTNLVTSNLSGISSVITVNDALNLDSDIEMTSGNIILFCDPTNSSCFAMYSNSINGLLIGSTAGTTIAGPIFASSGTITGSGGFGITYGVTATTGTFTTSVTAGTTAGSGTQLYRCNGGTDAGWVLYGNSGAAQTLCTTGGGSLVAISYFAP